MTKMLVYARLRTTLQYSSAKRYTEDRDGTPGPGFPALQGGERLLGYLSNPEPWENETLMFTTHAVHFKRLGGGWERLAYREFEGCEGPNTKMGALGLHVHSARGTFFLRAAGINSRNLSVDAWALYNFVRSVLDARSKNRLEP
jgi:hypothetical protein